MTEESWDSIDPIPWEDPQSGAFYIGYQMGLEAAIDALDDAELKKVFGVRIGKLAVESVMLPVREDNYKRAIRALTKAGKSPMDAQIAITAQGIKLRPYDLVERSDA